MRVMRAGVAVAAASGAIALPVGSALASAGPANTGDGQYCVSPPGNLGCVSDSWTADVQGTYGGVASGSYEVDKQVCSTDPSTQLTTCDWISVPGASGGPGPFAGKPGSLAKGGTYRLVIFGVGGGAIGSITGQDGLV